VNHLKRSAIGLASVAVVVVLYGLGVLAYQAAATIPDDPRVDAPRYGGRGPHAVGTRAVRLDGAPPLRLDLWYPASGDAGHAATVSYAYELKWLVRSRRPVRTVGRATRDAPFADAPTPGPLVVLSPGFALPSAGYVWLAERLASHGFVVVAPEHREAMDVALDGFWRSVIDRPADVFATLDWADREAASGGLLAGVADPDRVAIVGHSLGGTTALAMAGARLDLEGFARLCAEPAWREGDHAFLCELVLSDVDAMAARAGLDTTPGGLWPAVSDRRVDAVVAMASDAFLFGPAGLAPIDAPLLAVGGTADPSAPFAWSSAWAFEHAASPRKALAALHGAGHTVFAGSCDAVPFYRAIGAGGFCSDASWEMDRAHDAIAHLVTAFLRAELMDDGEAERDLRPEAVAMAGVDYRAQGYPRTYGP